MSNNLTKAVTTFRSGISMSSVDNKPEVSYEGGDFDAGYIKNFAVITSGEALGHGMWVDTDFVSDVALQLKKKKKGVVSRYTHPNMSGDALSKGLGRVKYTSDGDGKVRGDLHFYKAAHKSPDGNLAEYLMDLASDDPESFGASISFQRDVEAEEAYAAENPSSNDPRNVENLPHVRLGKLQFVDIVSQPAANPDGLFCQDKTFEQAEALFSYMLGLSEDKPDTQELFSVDADRLQQFTTRFLSTQGLELMKINFEEGVEPVEPVEQPVEPVEQPEVVEAPVEEQVEEVIEEQIEEAPVEEPTEEPTEEVIEEEAPVEEPAEEAPVKEDKGCYREELQAYVTAFGQEKGLEFFLGEVDFAEAQAKFIIGQKEEIAKLKQELSVAKLTEETPLSHGGSEDVKIKGGFSSKIKISN